VNPEGLQFVPVSVDEARDALDRFVVEPRRSVENPAKMRAPEDPSELVLSEVALRWRADLPDHVRPIALVRDFARITNRIAQLWPDAARCVRYLDSLVFSDRSARRGFPEEVGLEIAVLREHRMSAGGSGTVGQPSDAWAQVEGFERIDRRGAPKGA